MTDDDEGRGALEGSAPAEPSSPTAGGRPDAEPRPIIERIGLAAIAAVLAVLFGGVAAASWVGGEVFLAAMGAVGCAMTAWVGLMTLIRG
jgi:hypothetical protein